MSEKSKKKENKIASFKKELLTLGIKNFGPISSGEVTIRPLTVFIGPNNAGKSYLALLINSLFQSISPVSYESIKKQHLIFPLNYIFSKLVKDFMKYKKEILNMQSGEKHEISPLFIDKMRKLAISTYFRKGVVEQLNYIFGCDLNELIKNNKRVFNISLNFGNNDFLFTYYQKRNTIEMKKYEKIKVLINKSDKFTTEIQSKIENNKFIITIGKDVSEKSKVIEEKLIMIFIRIFSLFTFGLFVNFIDSCHYLPAARSGILQIHKTLSANIIRKLPLIEANKDIANLSGSLSIFLASLISLPNKNGPLYSIARELERELLDGELVTKETEKYRSPEIMYRFLGKEIPLNRASSTVTEIAPIIIYLKYYVNPGSTLIIEEPEAHLHPANQRILAKYLVRLIRENVKILITTHSEYLLEQLSNFMLMEKISSAKRIKKYKLKKNDYLSPDEVSAYVFNYDKKTEGFKINPVEIDEENGISQDEFIRINDSLYEQTIKIRKDLNLE